MREKWRFIMKNKIKKILESHELLRLATLDENGFPNVRSVDFANDIEDESKIYFTTFKETNKVKELANNNKVYIVVDKSANSIEELAKIQYIRGTGVATELDSLEEIQKAMGLLMTKYPFLKDLPGDPSMMSLFRIDLKEVKVTDNSLGFGHVDTFNY
ncbi:pyridoxamine 5'-phosphate oxidase family protein [Tepidibacter hydrothermalis]|uniref:Pyridoxamine 5'-phosphate oxidase family protein n=1 Tax=Tepidibacter hydrothermalis TaxID=3036126 RepID=A0ABY8EG38_9FIRM|nr:pyridoxamine 5'-phosphate oxidase family protein [Tepidibacter hydrothermalis]WFD11918.1 pyridoxamine 5'-phosphate oxidase family protein [Tepidibacter hydrothermalis]